MKKGILLSLFFLFFIPMSISSDTQFDEFKRSYSNDFQTFNLNVRGDFKSYRDELKKSFNKYEKESEKYWGKENSAVPGKKVWVQYRKGMNERNIVDFEKGTARVEILIPKEDLQNEKQIIEKIKDAVSSTITAKPDKRSIIDIAKNPGAVVEDKKEESVLKGQVENSKGEIVDKSNSKEFAEEIVKNSTIKKKSIKTEDGKEKIAVAISFKLRSGHLEKRAEKYRKIVLKEAKKRRVEPSLIFAIMETESAFNPRAKSPVPAFGLMQLVPVSGGRDAYKFVHGRDLAPTDTYLYNPGNNVELGAAYYYILFNRYLKNIENERARLWCSVASYNTGAGNLLSVFAGKYSGKKFKNRKTWRDKAFTKINSMEEDEVFNKLVKELPYKETRKYIVKIKNRIPKYRDN